MNPVSRRRLIHLGAGAAVAASAPALAQSDAQPQPQPQPQPRLVYADGLRDGWTTTGWARVELEAAFDDQKPVALFMPAWSNFGFKTDTPILAGQFTIVNLLVHGGERARQPMVLRLKSGDETYSGSVPLRPPRNEWSRYEILIDRHLRVRGDDTFDTIEVFNPTGEELSPWYLNFLFLQ